MKKITTLLCTIFLILGCTSCTEKAPPAFYPTLDLYKLNDEIIMDFDKNKKNYVDEYYEIFVSIDYLIEKSQSFRSTPIADKHYGLERAKVKILGQVENSEDFNTLIKDPKSTYIIRGKITDIAYHNEIYIQMDIYEIVEW